MRKISMWSLGVVSLLAQPLRALPVVIDENFKKVDMTPFVEVLTDPTSAIDVTAATAPGATGYVPIKSASMGISNSTFWSRFQVNNPGTRAESLLFEVGYPALDRVTFFSFEANGLKEWQTTGDTFPFETRALNYKTFLYPINVDPGTTRTFYVRAWSTGSVNLESSLWRPNAFAVHVSSEQSVLGVYYGIMIALILYNMFLLFSTKEIAYLHYSGYMGANLMTYTCWNGVAFQVMWPNSPWFNNYGVGLGALFITIFSLLFAREYMNFKVRSRRLLKVNDFGIMLGLAIFVAFAFVSTRIGLLASLGFLALSSFFLMAATAHGVSQRYRPSYFYALSWVLTLFSGVYAALSVFGVVPMNDFSRYVAQFCAAINGLLLSFGLGDKVNQLKKERYQAQKKLGRNLEALLSSTKLMAVAPSQADAGRIAARSIAAETASLSEPSIALLAGDGTNRTVLCRYVEAGQWFDDAKAEPLPDDHPLRVRHAELATLRETFVGDGEMITPIESKSAGRSFLWVRSRPGTAVATEEVSFVGAMASSLAVALENIFYLNHLQELVDQRTAELQDALSLVTAEKAKQKFLLEHMQHGIVTFGDKLKIDDEFSSFVPRFYQTDAALIAGLDIIDFVLREANITPDERNQCREALGFIMGEEEIAWIANSSSLLQQAEVTIGGAKRIIGFSWTPILNADSIIERIMLSINDVTEEIEAKRRLKETQEANDRLVTVIGEVIKNDGKRVREFLQDTHDRLVAIEPTLDSGSADRGRLFSEMHTIKGVSRMFGLKGITNPVHAAEDMIKGDQANWEPKAFREAFRLVVDAVTFYLEVVSRFAGQAAPGAGAEVAERDLSLHGFIGQMMPIIRKALVKEGLTLAAIDVRDGVVDWSPAGFSAVTTAIMHALNNGADHGYILPKGRGEAVPAAASFTVATGFNADGDVRITVSDSGNGFQLEKIRALAAKRGFVPRNESEEALLAVLLEDGVSTAGAVTQSSGRGVGMGAVKRVAEDLKGALTLRRNDPRGALVELILPASAVCASVPMKVAA